MEVLEEEMLEDPASWKDYYHGNPGELKMKRRYSYSDRCRYYFARSKVKKAREKLMENLSRSSIPLYLLSQYMPVQYAKIREGKLLSTAEALVEDKIQDVMDRYYGNMLLGRVDTSGF